MNTVLKGDIFEKKVFNLIKDLLDNDEYYLNSKRSYIFQKKKYYSDLRENYIICDISIECYMNGAKEYSHLNIIECKNLEKNVTIDDIEEFDSKLSQIGKHNTKGTMVSSKGFAKSVINMAKKLKIALLVIKSDNHYEWINYRKDNIDNTNFEDNNSSFIGLVEGKTVTNLADYLLKTKLIDTYRHQEKYIYIKYIQVEELESIVQRLYKYDIHDNFKLNIDKMCSFLSEKYSVDFDFSSSDNNFLGKIEFSPLKIFMQKNLDEHRLRFTFCHEVGHLILHSKLLKGIEHKEDDEYTLSLTYNATEQFKRRLEYQANIFASLLLLPTEPFIEEVGKYCIKNNIRRTLYLDSQHVNKILVYELLSILSNKFGASHEAVKIRLISLKLLNDKSDFSFKGILKDFTK